MPGCIKKIDKKGGGFALMQNIERFQQAAKDWGVPVREVFQTVDLWERKNIPQVTLCIHALGRVVGISCCIINEPQREKTKLRGFRSGLTQTELYSHRKRLEA